MKRLLIARAVLPAVARADAGADTLVARYGAPVDACRAASDTEVARRACSGRLFDACSRGEDGRQSNRGMSRWMSAETANRDRRLNEDWRRVIPLAQAAGGVETDPGYALRADRLLAAPRARVASRDAQCDFEHEIFATGSMRLPLYPGCLSDMTFQRGLDIAATGNALGV